MGIKSIHFLNSEEGDWVGIYIDGVLEMEGHSFRADELAEYLGKRLGIRVTSEERGSDWFDKQGNACPEKQPKKK